jgi:transglutaminase-like putative cysteine protease
MSASGALAPLVGVPSQNGRAVAPRPANRVAGAGEPVLPPALARGTAFLALAVFGSLHWMAMLEPTASGRALAAIGVGALALLGLLAAELLRPRARTLVAVAVAVVAVGLAFLAAGVADELLRPDRWGVLAAGIGRGISALPGARVPYRGIDEWTRLVIALGGTLLVALAALAAFWPRRDVTGWPLLALILLVLLYVVPAVALDFGGEFLRGALLVVLVLAFLRLERLRAREAGAAAGLAAAAAILGLMLAPALDGNDPWWDYETWALSTAASQSTSFSWDHTYGPLNWPRDGREMLRVKARQQAYWKAENLDAFDGHTWQRAHYGVIETPDQELPLDRRNLTRWTQSIEVTVRNLHSRTFVTAGIPLAPPDMPNRRSIPAGPPGIWAASQLLRRGDTYRARVYTPRPTERELNAAGSIYERPLVGFRSIRIDDPDEPAKRAPGFALVPAIRATFPAWGAVGAPVVVERESYRPGVTVKQLKGERLIERSDLRRTWDLSQRLKADAKTPFQYVRSVERYLGRGFSYSESPPASARTLDGFLFDAKSGYCQQYSGAMALLLRMGGVPARVATGFSGGSLDTKTHEYVVRDLDAHSWVEAWFPSIGWVTFDPTPSSAPPRSQGEEPTTAGLGDAPQFGAAGAEASARLPGEGTQWGRIAGLVVLALVLLAVAFAAVLHYRRRSPLSPLNELERALHRARRAPAPGATLQALERAFVASPAAAAYVRALREQRYAKRRELAGPTGAQRRGLRAELARGGGLRARLRAWWALPPKPPARRRTLDAHG